MPRDPRAYLYDVIAAADRIAGFTTETSLDAYRNDDLVRSGVERQFTIIGEAVSQLSRHHPEIADRLTHRARIVAFRNILIHAYASIDDAIVWDLIEGGLALLRQEASTLIESLDPDSGPATD
jgi:uncharacterized protein with HEPN domain